VLLSCGGVVKRLCNFLLSIRGGLVRMARKEGRELSGFFLWPLLFVRAFEKVKCGVKGGCGETG
jgi:hypothetical protein